MLFKKHRNQPQVGSQSGDSSCRQPYFLIVAGPNGTAKTYTYICDGTDPASPVLADGTAIYTPGIAERRGTTSSYYHDDALGSTRLMTGNTGSVSDTFNFDAFGSTLSRTGSTPTPFGFVGKQGYQTDGSSLMLLGHRYYDSSIGRFISQDPAQDENNWYAYCGSNPLTRSDPVGLAWLEFHVSDVVQGLKTGTAALASSLTFGLYDSSKYSHEPGYALSRASGAVARECIIQAATMGAGNAIKAARAARAVAAAGRAAKAAPGAKAGAEVTEGIYEFVSNDGRPYVGQSKDIARRIAQHLRSGKLPAENLDTVRKVEVLGGKTAREIAEQTRIREFGGVENLNNVRNPIGAARSYLMPPRP